MELAEQYAAMDAASNVARRRVLADHLREVIDQLERKGDQIASLYELLSYKDQPLAPEDHAERADHDEDDVEEPVPRRRSQGKGRAEAGTQTSTRYPPSTLRRSA
jgi:hypothetical protein